jgi:transposase InsO family protein
MARKRYTPEQIIRLLKETEVLSREVFDTLLDAKVLVERWRREYNHIRPHSSLGYRP